MGRKRTAMTFALTGMTFALTAMLTGCTLIADPDQFSWAEGSPPDSDNSDTTSENGTDSAAEPDSTTETSGDTGDSETERTPTDSDSEGETDRRCESDDDCADGARCPMFFTDDLFEELESRCYADCRADPQVCEKTENPLCYRYTSGAVCLERATLSGSFTCRLLTATNSSQLDLKIRPDQPSIRLTRCEIFTEDGSTGFGFVFSTVLDGAVFEASLYVPERSTGDLQTGIIHNASGSIFRHVLDSAMTPTESAVLGFFPEPGVAQDPVLDRRFEIVDTVQGGAIQGVVDFDGFAYNAQLRL